MNVNEAEIRIDLLWRVYRARRAGFQLMSIRHDCDWASMPEPWCWIGPRFRAECQGLTPRDETATQRMAGEIKRRRKALGLTQSALGRMVGCHPATILRIEKKRLLSDDITARIIQALDQRERQT